MPLQLLPRGQAFRWRLHGAALPNLLSIVLVMCLDGTGTCMSLNALTDRPAPKECLERVLGELWCSLL